MFKSGDRVKYKSGTTFSNGRYVNTVDKIVDGCQVWLLETKTWVGIESIEHESPTASPVRTVTRREIVPGTYGRIKVTGTYEGNRVTMEWDRSDVITAAVPIVGLSAEELREAAHILNQLAEALEDKS